MNQALYAHMNNNKKKRKKLHYDLKIPVFEKKKFDHLLKVSCNFSTA
jgi:hypothetical protein